MSDLRPKLQGWMDPVDCPQCREGSVVLRRGPYGEFFGCSRFPACTFKTDHYGINQLLDPDPDEPYYGM